MTDAFKSPWVTYIGIAIALAAMFASIMPWGIDPNILWGIAGFVGFGSIASLRAYIDSKGLKTYIATGIPMVFGALSVFGVITYDNYQTLIALFAPLTGISLQQAIKKSQSQAIK